jgi:imidazoleglycerol phosphate synthase glutamine amidotransferase subunit HisH
MDHWSSEVDQQPPKQQHIEWRRSRVLELSSQGRTEREIATILKVGPATIGIDLAYLRKQSQENLKSHIQKYLPEQYQKCINGLNQVLKMGWNSVTLDSVNHTNRLQALSLINDCYKYLMDLTTNSVVITTDAIKFVQINKEKLTTMSSKEEKSNESKEADYSGDKDQLEEKQEEETRELDKQKTTTNQVF